MQTLVLRIPDAVAAELKAEAARRRTSKSAIARERLAHRADPAAQTAGSYDLIADLVGCAKGGPPDLSANAERYLKKTGYGRAKRRR